MLERQGLACGYTELPLNQVEAGDGFRHRMLDLQPRIHLHKVELHLSIKLLGNKFHRAGAHVIDSARSGHGGFAHLAAQGFCHAGGRGFFQHFLVAPLHRAVALEQVNIVALRVAKNLDLNVARALRVFFNQHRIIAKAVDGFAPAGGQGCGEVFGFVHRAHAFAAAAGAGLDQHRVTDAVGFALQERRVLVAAVVTGHQRHAGFFHELLGLGL